MRSVLLAAGVAAGAAAANPFVVSAPLSGDFAVTVPGWPGFSIAGGEVGVFVGGKWVSSSAGLTPANPETFSGSDV